MAKLILLLLAFTTTHQHAYANKRHHDNIDNTEDDRVYARSNLVNATTSGSARANLAQAPESEDYDHILVGKRAVLSCSDRGVETGGRGRVLLSVKIVPPSL